MVCWLQTLVMVVVIGRFLKLYRWAQINILPEALPLWDQQGLLSLHRFMLRGGTRGQYLGHYVFFLSLEDCLMDQYYIWDIGSVWHKHWPEIKYVGQWPAFHGSKILLYVLKTIWWTNVGSMWCKDLPYYIYVHQWSIFYGPVILSCILKTIWWMNVVLKILMQFDTNTDLKLYM